MMLHFLNDVANDAESTQTIIENYVIIASLKSETICQLINRIPGSRFLISSLPGSALWTHVESLVKPRNVNVVFSFYLKALPGKPDIKRHSPSILYLDIRFFLTSILSIIWT